MVALNAMPWSEWRVRDVKAAATNFLDERERLELLLHLTDQVVLGEQVVRHVVRERVVVA